MQKNIMATAALNMKTMLAIVLLGSIMATACNSDDSKTKVKSEKSDAKDEDESADDVSAFATGFCNCLEDLEGNLSSKTKKMFIKAADSDDPTTTLQNEMMKIEDEDEQKKIAEEFQSLDGDEATDRCMKKLDKKYNMTEPDKKTQKKVLSKVEDECSEFAAALMKIGFAELEKNNE